mmetsp:Transcript_45801/g.99520  ORF Transcript_45801/g.99520 Transcript_45801/m.99520 type:complete len:693 (-) Transcript_45801:63-2141(-)
MTKSLALLITARVALAVTPIAKVLELLDDLKKEIQQEGKDETKEYNAYLTWCHNTQEDTQNTIDTGKAKIEDLASFIQQQIALQDKLRSEIEQVSNELSSNEKELADDTKQRKAEHKEFLDAEAAYVKALDELNLAIQVMEKKLGASSEGEDLLQQDAHPSMVKVAERVRHVLEAGVDLTSTQQTTLDTFLQQALNKQDPVDSVSFLQVQARQHAPAQAMLSLIDTLKSVRESTEKKRHNAQLEETRQESGFKELEVDLKNQIETGSQSMATKKSDLARSEQLQAESEGELSDTQKSVIAAEEYLDTVVQQCEDKARAWKDQVRTRSDELTAIQEAVVILSSDAGKAADKISTYGADFAQLASTDSFVQIPQRATVNRARHHLLESHASPRLALLATRMRSKMVSGLQESTVGSDPFGKVRGMIEDMVERLMKEQAEEAEHEAWCNKETSKSTKQKKKKDRAISEFSNRFEELTAQIAQLSDELQQLAKETADMESTLTEATRQRQEERTSALTTIKAQEDAQMLVKNAIEVLKAFYDKQKSSFAQVSAAAGQPDVDQASTKDNQAAGIIGILEIALDDFSKLQKQTEIEEKTATQEYKKLKSETQIQKAVNQKTIEFKTEQKQRMEGELLSTKNDLGSFKASRASIQEYLDQLKETCEFKVPAYEQRAERRNKEIQSLQEAMNILNGEAIA